MRVGIAAGMLGAVAHRLFEAAHVIPLEGTISSLMVSLAVVLLNWGKV